MTSQTSNKQSDAFLLERSEPGVLVAYAPIGATTVDRCRLSLPFNVGRGRSSTFIVTDDLVSKQHLAISQNHGTYWIEDIGSTNGTFVNGCKVEKKQCLPDRAIIRAGRIILVFHETAGQMLRPLVAERYGMAGKFHVASILEDLTDASQSDRQILLTGASGTGKELAAKALASMMSTTTKPLRMLSFNAARFTSEDEIMSTLFGVTKRVFSDVDARPGLIEQAADGILFLDEIHTLPARVQRGLLRVMEDGQYSRIGETQTRPAHVRFIFACNAPGPTYSLAHDFLFRTRVVSLPPLSDRVADIPTIFDSVLKSALKRKGLATHEVSEIIKTDHYEALCLNGFQTDNVRGLIDLADRIVTRIASGAYPEDAAKKVFTDRFGKGIVAKRQESGEEQADITHHYEKYKRQIIRKFDECSGNLSATERALRANGVMCTRRWLGIYLERWGVRKKIKHR